MDLRPFQRPLQNTDDDAPAPEVAAPSAIYSMYITCVQKFGIEKYVENLKGDAETILVFAGLLSSTAATFIALSYPTLQQDPNLTTYTTTGLSVQSPFVPPTSVVFINSVWFLSLVLSLTPAHTSGQFKTTTRPSIIFVYSITFPEAHLGSASTELLPVLLHLSMFLFFAGLAVFTFRGNHIVAYCTSAVVGLCALLYITLVLYHVAGQLHKYWSIVGTDLIKSLNQRKNKAMSPGYIFFEPLDEDKPLSAHLYRNLLVPTLYWLNGDHELGEFVVFMSPRPSPHTTMTTIIQLAQRAFTNGLPRSDQRRRTRACLRALYYIPGAIHDVLAAYAAREEHFQEVSPLLNTPESLEIIDELWDSPNDDVALSIRSRTSDFVLATTMSLLIITHAVTVRGCRIWASPVFLPAARQDLITLTLEILARVPVADTTPPQCAAFHDAYEQLAQVISTHVDEQALVQALVRNGVPRGHRRARDGLGEEMARTRWFDA
ncbi:hypothetical protein H4582DRAFT_2128559 [Lactarius indigo]|nr:hypothetical protein H4582DRAFT_2128559 [Lactarius indigo]